MSGDHLGDTSSLCPVCLKRLPARRVGSGGVVRLTRTCPEHGEASVPIWRGEPPMASWRRAKTPSPPNPEGASRDGCPFDCGLCPDHAQHTCTALVEITARCDLGCPVCFASSGLNGGPRDPSLDDLTRMFRDIQARAGACNLQISGGEPTVRDDLEQIVSEAARAGFPLVQLNTNGLRLGREKGFARRQAEAGLSSVFLQFDGSDQACMILRGRPLLAAKLKAVEACAEAGLGVVLVPTLARGVNDAECGDIIRLALTLGPIVRGVHFQPMAAFGRHPGGNGERGLHGPTLPEVLSALESQTQGLLRTCDFHPPCCEHELCSFSGTFLRREGGLSPMAAASNCCAPAPQDIPTALEGAVKSRAFTARQWSAPDAPPPPGPMADDFDRFLAESGTRNRFTISCMAFQDAWTIDLERARGCCIHVAAPDGSLIPFCLYNLTSASGRPLHRGAHGGPS
ncbi:radical SAM (seleno)protein TrsS [Fundidesulfovibrio terrae]|uniref:radical SAM (seleno)protein TrsS n=1 Tax=Fundidesulfovibrio terrae TaxID=2922866 RepID=UPI001FAE9186|nr:radical SAM (seleno)protein TrsS [Fundidesulfovibrio terrae]